MVDIGDELRIHVNTNVSLYIFGYEIEITLDRHWPTSIDTGNARQPLANWK